MFSLRTLAHAHCPADYSVVQITVASRHGVKEEDDNDTDDISADDGGVKDCVEG
jgi:hypothetical protein